MLRHRWQIAACLNFLLLILLGSPALQAACAAPDRRLEPLLEGDTGPLGRFIDARVNLEVDPQSEEWAAVLTLRLDAAGWKRGFSPDPPILCLAFLLETEDGYPVVEQRQVDLGDAEAAWTFQRRARLPATTSQIFALVEHPASGAWGGALVEQNEDAPPRPGPNAVRLDANTWHEGRGTETRPAGESAKASHSATVLRLIPPRDQPVSGSTRFQTLISNDAVDRVVFFLDGQQVAESKRRPFSARIPLAAPPRPQTVRAVAYDQFGRAFGEDELTVNELDAPFRVKIAQISGDPASGQVDVSADVTVPADAELTGVEFYLNEQPIVAQTSPPFRATIPTPNVQPTDFIRVAAVLADGRTIDDAVLLAAPGATEEVEVNLVELQVVVTDADGQPIEDLQQDDFAVIFEQKPRTIDNFAYADDVPLTLGLVVDTSGSMRLLMHDTRQAAAKFLGTTVLPQDSAFIVDFDQSPRLLQPVTDDMTTLLTSLARLDAYGRTALYDAVVFSMLQFEERAGRKALVVLSDGDDHDSRFGPKECVAYGHEQGAPVYVIGLGELDTYRRIYPKKELRRITGETGGRLYFVDSFAELDAAYAQIGKELRSQYTLSFYADRDLTNAERRAVTVRVNRPGATVRTVVGVRPKNSGS